MTLAEEIIFGGSIVSNKNILVLIFEGDCRLVKIQLKTKWVLSTENNVSKIW